MKDDGKDIFWAWLYWLVAVWAFGLLLLGGMILTHRS